MRCKYSFTDEQLPVSPWKQVKERQTKKSELLEKSSSEEEEIREVLVEITRNVKCPRCLSTAYLTGIGEKREFEIDLTSEPLVQLIKGAIDIVKSEKKEDISKDYIEYAQGIIDLLILNPGKLIYFPDPDLIKEAEYAFNIIWDNVDTDELFTALHSDVMVGITVDYIHRAIKLKPTLVSVKPDNQTSVYFQDAMHSWLFGLNSAALILCCSIIENLLKQKLSRKPNLVWESSGNRLKERKLSELINNAANEGLLDKSVKKMAHDIRLLRRDAVHRLKPISSNEAYNAIMNTKKIIEQLLK